MKRLALSALAFCFLTFNADAKRTAPPVVQHIQHQNMVLTAPSDLLGMVEARTTSGRLLWRKQIYVIKYDPQLERDVQDVFIKHMSMRTGQLIIRNEKGFEYALDPQTLRVEVLKGKAVFGR